MSSIMNYIIDENLINTDPNGFLLDLNDWSEEIAQNIAAEEGITLSDEHWQVINFLRQHYIKYGSSPNVRLLIKVLLKEFGEDVGNKKHLYNLFPHGPSRQGCRIAGLPMPNDCVDWPG